jgi:hypothetical protein
MSIEVSSSLPRKKRSILWWLAGLFLLLLGVFFFQLFGPNPRIIVSRQTTYLTEPLGRNGLPDYERYVLEQYREGVTPQNNGATLLWKALWPGELSPNEYAEVAKELGLSSIPSKQESLVPIYRETQSKRVAAWLTHQAAETGESTTGADSSTPAAAGVDPLLGDAFAFQNSLEQATEQLFQQAISRRWTSQQIPPLAQWIHENQKPLDLLVEASRRPRCYFPMRSLLNRDQDPLISLSLSGVQGTREVGRSLPARAMWHLGEGRPNEAWQDLLAVHRIARLISQGNTLIEQLVAFAIDGVARNGTQTLLHHGNLSTEQVQQIRRDLNTLPPFAGAATALDQGERLLTVDLIVHLASTKDMSWEQMAKELNIDTHGMQVLEVVSVDWNLVLQELNAWYDRLVTAARLPDHAKRTVAMDQMQADVQILFANAQTPTRLALSAVSRRQRSEVVAALMLGLFLPMVDVTVHNEDRANAAAQLTQLAAALAEYRAAHGAYPAKLDDLAPAFLEKPPTDFFNAAPFFYKRDGEGYLLYSAGENGADDGGSNEILQIHIGQPLEWFDQAEAEKLRSKIPARADDISIRLPREPLKLPTVAPNADGP